MNQKKSPMFLRFINKETGVNDLLLSFAQSSDDRTASAAQELLNSPPDLTEFHKELKDAVYDLVDDGVGDEFVAFVNHYMEPSLEEDLTIAKTPLGENRSQVARVKDKDAPWVQGFICYNICLYIKAFGLESLKRCKVCSKLFCHKGKYAVYCSDECKKKKKSD